MNRICLALTARNEAQAIGACLRSVIRSVEVAEAHLPLRFDLVVIADDCTDQTAAIAQSFARVRVIVSSGGKLEAQRQVANTTAFVLYSDADIVLGENTVTAVCAAMLENPDLQVAYPLKKPLPPMRTSLLARALYCYNRVNGFQEPRRYFNGKFFAIRDWSAPSPGDLAPRLASLPPDRFYDFHRGMRVDDIWLSRDILRRYGAGAIREIDSSPIWYRPPETFTGMYRTYHRMRLEIERLNLLFPETRPVHQHRGYDWAAVRQAPSADRWLWRIFRITLGVCRVRYRLTKFYYQHFSSAVCAPWPPIEETKQSLDTALPG